MWAVAGVSIALAWSLFASVWAGMVFGVDDTAPDFSRPARWGTIVMGHLAATQAVAS